MFWLIGTILTLIVFGVIAGASWQAGRAFGPPRGVGAFLGLLVVSWLPWIGWPIAFALACVLGYRAEVAIEQRGASPPLLESQDP